MCLLALICWQDAARSFNDNCALGIEPNLKRINDLLSQSLMLVTALNTHIGYYKAAEIAQEAHKNGTTLRDEAVRLKYLTEKEFDEIVRPEKMVGEIEA